MLPQQFQLAAIPFKQREIKYNKQPNHTYNQDIIPGVYEGGFKVWECTIDLLKYIGENSQNFIGKRVLEIGCGHGLVGIGALKCGAQLCCFQDYNQDVLDNITKTNLILNDVASENCQFLAGDWNNLGGLEKYDIILGSEIVYKQENYMKIVELCKRMLAQGGLAIFANKHYYFGVGGNMEDFKQCLENNGMCYQSYAKICPPKGGNKKQIIGVWLKNNVGGCGENMDEMAE